MIKHRNKSVFANLLCLLFVVQIISIGQFRLGFAQIRDEFAAQQLELLAKAGYQDTVPSLVSGLKDENILTANAAAYLLRRHSYSEQAVAALEAAIAEPRSRVAVSAAYSLFAIGNRRWVQKAVTRLPMMNEYDQIPQVQLSGLLAQVGNTKGMKYVVNAIMGDTTVTIGLNQIAYFDGKLNEKGKRIVVLDELTSLVEKAQPKAREKILEKIKQLRAGSGK